MNTESSAVVSAQDHFLGVADLISDRYRSRVGNTNKTRHKLLLGVIFLERLRSCGGSFFWADGKNRGDKLADIWQALSQTSPEYADKSLVDKGHYVSEEGSKLRSGFYQAREWMQTRGETIYLIPSHSESGVYTILTFDPNYETPSGKTAGQMQVEREEKLLGGQMRASFRRVASVSRGDIKAPMALINSIIDEIQKEHAEEFRLIGEHEDERPTTEE